MKVFFLKGPDSKPDLENNASHSNRKLDESIDGSAATRLIAKLKECLTILHSFETAMKIKSSSSGNEDETEVDVLEMDDEISDEKYLNALREADRYGKKKKS